MKLLAEVALSAMAQDALGRWRHLSVGHMMGLFLAMELASGGLGDGVSEPLGGLRKGAWLQSLLAQNECTGDQSKEIGTIGGPTP